MKDKKCIAIANAFRKNLNKSDRTPNKIWVNKGNTFYNRSIKSWQGESPIEMYSAHNEEESIVAERSIRNLTNKICNYMTSISKMCIS